MWLSVRRKYLDDFVSANSELLFQRYIDALIKAVFSDEQIIDDLQKEVMHVRGVLDGDSLKNGYMSGSMDWNQAHDYL